jgi:multiple sugar transport system permease protein
VRAEPITRATVRPRRKAGRTVRGLGELVFVLPVVLCVGVLVVWPTASALAHSFTNWQPGYSSPWVGLANFRGLLSSDSFRQILVNQAFLLLGLPLWVVTPLLISALLFEGVPFPGVFRTVYFFPATVSPAVIGILFAFVLAPTGPLNTGLRDIGLGGLAGNWLANEHLVKPVIIGVLAWASIGTGVVIFSAAMSAIPLELYEAATLDGGNWWQRFWYVTVPSVRRVIELWIVILVITVFVAVFPWIFTLTRGGPGYSSTTIDYDIYQNALTDGYFGTAAAEAVMLLVIVSVVIGVGGLAFRRRGASS